MKNNLITPKITLTIYETNGRRYWIRPSIRKMRNLMRISLVTKFKIGARAKLRIVYGKAKTAQGAIEVFDNQAEVNNLDDLITTFNAFIDKDLWISKKDRNRS